MKQLILILILLKCQIVLSQHIIKLDADEAKTLFRTFSKQYYVEKINDKRIDKDKYFGTVKKGIFSGTTLSACFEKDSITDYLQNFFDFVLPKEDSKKALTLNINFFRVGESQTSAYAEEGFVYLDVDFFTKDSLNQQKQIAHYHGKYYETLGYDVTESHPERIREIFIKAFERIAKQKNWAEFPKKVNFTDTLFVPKAGFYRTFLDYQYNTPFQVYKKFKMYSEVDQLGNDVCVFHGRNDSVKVKKFGYSDGNSFYSYSENTLSGAEFRLIKTRGRFLVLKNFITDLTSSQVFGNAVLSSGAFGVAGSIAAGNNHVENVVFDLYTGNSVTIHSEEFENLLNQFDKEGAYKKYEASRKKIKDAIEAIDTINKKHQAEVK